jgi:hypothetical protein
MEQKVPPDTLKVSKNKEVNDDTTKTGFGI